jgi:predicted DNA-binding transcriptional regulator AlpA
MPELQNSEGKKSDWISAILAGHMTPKELACALGVSERTLGRWHQFRQGPPRVELGRKVFYRLESVSAWMASCERPEPRADRVKRVRFRSTDPSRAAIPMKRNHVGALARPSGSHN